MASHPKSQAGGMDGTDCFKPSVSMQCWEAFGKVQAQACQSTLQAWGWLRGFNSLENGTGTSTGCKQSAEAPSSARKE